MSDTEFKPKPLTAKETMKMNLFIAAAIFCVFAFGIVVFHYHTDPVSAYAAAPATPKL